MDNPRVLPPLVRGKVMSVLDFFIDEIVISRNALSLTENLDITVLVQWWGEVLPATIRPSVLKLQDGISISKQSLEACCHSVRYEIKTTTDLLKLYLKACEVVELTVSEAVENFIVGSAFLKNPSNLLIKKNDFILSPIFDCLGEEIGQIKIRINFFEYPQEKKDYSVFKNRASDTNLDALEHKISELLKRNYIFQAEKTIFYDGRSNKTNIEIKSDGDLEFDKFPKKNDNNTASLVSSNYESKTELRNSLTDQIEKSSRFISLPKVSTLTDSSKILNFDLSLKTEKPEKNKKSRLSNKFTSNSIKSKSKLKYEKLNPEVSSNRQKTLQNFVSKKSIMTKTNEVDSKMPPAQQLDESFSIKNSELENTSQASANKMVYDYLLGSPMSKENEESALKNLKKMSPCQGIISAINELCLSSEEVKVSRKNCMKHNLCFDLTNPIEKSYYEKFFDKYHINDFEIVELLNEPQNIYTLEKGKSNDRNIKENSFRIKESCGNDVTRNCEDSSLDNLAKMNRITYNCNRCKYSKKLNELDTIIESLKHFEKNMLKQEKKLQLDFEANLNKQSGRMPDRQS